MESKDDQTNISAGNDPLLLPFLTCEKGERSQIVLTRLFEEHADPICTQIVRFRTRNIMGMTYLEKENLREDLKQEARLKILTHLRFLQENPATSEPIYDFRNYVGRVTHNLLHDYFRAEFRPAATFEQRRIQLPPGEVNFADFSAGEILPPAAKMFLPDFALSVEDEEERIFKLERLWLELKQLSAHQCAAWLFKIADQNEESTLKWLPVFKIATIREIAQATGQTAESLAALWNELPLADQKIAALFNVTPRQVINWRKCANERLQRRLKNVFAQFPKKIKASGNI